MTSQKLVEIANALKVLWDKRLIVLIGLVAAQLIAWASAFQITFPPTLESKSIEFGAATTQVLLDTRQSPLFDAAASVEPLASRAELYVQLVTTPPVHRAISRAAGTGRGELVISGRSESTGTKSSREPHLGAAREPARHGDGAEAHLVRGR